MLAARLSSSSRPARGGTAAAFAAAMLAGIAGCASNGALLPGAGLRLATFDTAPAVAMAAEAVPQPRIEPAAETRAATDIVTKPMAASRQSAWCDYLREDSAAEAMILRAPTLGGQVDDEGRSSVNIGISMSGLRKAELIEEAAEARCRRYLAESGLQKLVFTAPQELTASGFRAKADAIMNRKADTDRLRARIKRELKAGNINAEKAANLQVMIDQLFAMANEARSQVERRLASQVELPDGASVLGAELLQAEAELQDINSRTRSADAFDVSLEAGYSTYDITDGFDTVQEGLNGKVTFSMKLGAFAPQRHAHEARAKEARLAAVRDQEGGALWQVRVLRLAHERAISGLVESRLRLDQALAETSRLLAKLEAAGSGDFAGAAMQARIEHIRLEAERAAVDGSIVEIRSNIERLKAG